MSDEEFRRRKGDNCMIAKVETPGAIAAWRIAMAVMTLVMAALLTTISVGISRTNSIAENARDNNNKQDQAIILLQAQTSALQRVSDASVTSLQALTLQMTRNGDRLDQLNDAQKAALDSIHYGVKATKDRPNGGG